MGDRLTNQQNIENIIESGLQLIPYVGGALSTLYFGRKQQKEFNRILDFYEDLSRRLSTLGVKISLDDQDEGQLLALIEKINNKIEKEVLGEKLNHFKHYFENILLHPVKEDYDEKVFFLDALDSMTILEIDVLKSLIQQSEPVMVGNIQKEGIDQYAIVGAISRLRNLGFVELATTSMVIGGTTDNRLTEKMKISSFGKKFIDFCLNA